MKVKLLKKIRNRFTWKIYFDKTGTKSIFYLLDKYKKEAIGECDDVDELITSITKRMGNFHDWHAKKQKRIEIRLKKQKQRDYRTEIYKCQ